jgi:hypothetical protein
VPGVVDGAFVDDKKILWFIIGRSMRSSNRSKS